MKKQLLRKNGRHDILGAEKRVRSMQKNAGREEVGKTGADDAGEPEQVYRDAMKSLVAMKDECAVYLLLGIENQGDVHYAMPVKNLVYDVIHYAKQVQEAANSHRKAMLRRGWRMKS